MLASAGRERIDGAGRAGRTTTEGVGPTDIRKIVTHRRRHPPRGRPARRSADPARRHRRGAPQPVRGRYVEDLGELIAATAWSSAALIAPLAVAQLGGRPVHSYGKGGIVGMDGELEHVAAMLHPEFGAPLREACGGGKAIIPSAKKRGGPGCTLDVPLHYKDAAFVRTHFDAVELRITDAPGADELVIAVAVTDGGRPLPRVGGLERGRDRRGGRPPLSRGSRGMSDLLIRNIGTIVTGDVARAVTDGDTVVVRDGTIAFVGREASADAGDIATVVDAAGATVMPGLCDDHVHPVLGDYTPRQLQVELHRLVLARRRHDDAVGGRAAHAGTAHRSRGRQGPHDRRPPIVRERSVLRGSRSTPEPCCSKPV